jgi:hypothetical protein
MPELMKYICNLQFGEEHAKAALEFTGYDLANAISLLVYGKAVGVDGQEHSVIEDDLAEKQKVSRINDYVKEPEEVDLKLGKVVVRRTEEEKKLNEAMKTFTDEQKMAVTRLVNRFRDQNTVLQVYLACDRNEVAAANCLQTMG